MTITFTTETGSIYHLDSLKMTWQRIHTTDKSGPVRGSGAGKLLSWPVIEIGKPAVLMVEPDETSPKDAVRLIRTSHVLHVACPASQPS